MKVKNDNRFCAALIRNETLRNEMNVNFEKWTMYDHSDADRYFYILEIC